MLDMFRDKLEFAQGELAEEKNRLAEFASRQAHDALALEASYQQINNLGALEF